MEKEYEINFVTFFWIAWDHKFLVIAVSLVCGIIATVIALTATPMFRAQVIVTQYHEKNMGGAGGLMGQLGGLASIAGLNLGGNADDAERTAFLASRGLVEAFVKHYGLMQVINGKSKDPNSVWAATERFRTLVLDLHEDKLKETTTITVDWRDPVVAARWANDFIAFANDLLRTRAIEESTRNIAYLNKQSAQTNVVEVQHALNGLIENETKNLMAANGRIEYAFTIVDPAVVPEQRFSPRRTLIVISGLFIGGVLGSLIAWARKAIRRRPPLATT
jgi:uncharacterized protein involved in exopolysaccharide biosynthesis